MNTLFFRNDCIGQTCIILFLGSCFLSVLRVIKPLRSIHSSPLYPVCTFIARVISQIGAGILCYWTSHSVCKKISASESLCNLLFSRACITERAHPLGIQYCLQWLPALHCGSKGNSKQVHIGNWWPWHVQIRHQLLLCHRGRHIIFIRCFFFLGICLNTYSMGRSSSSRRTITCQVLFVNRQICALDTHLDEHKLTETRKEK